MLNDVQLSSNVDEKIEAFQSALEPLRQTLQHFRWLGGDKVSYADISVASQFLVRKYTPYCGMWHVCVSEQCFAVLIGLICTIVAGRMSAARGCHAQSLHW